MIRNENPVIANSLWSATAAYPTEYPQLVGEQKSDVTVIGAGFTGLSAAIHLAEQGVNVILVDAQHPGWGASGRNGGQVNVGLKDGPTGIKAKFGDFRGTRMIQMAGDAGDLVFDLVDRYDIECDAKRPGWLRAAHTHKTLRELHKLAEDWDKYGGGMRQLDQSEMKRLTGTETYLGGVLDRRGGVLHPLNYAFGLAEAGRRNGVQIFGETPANQIKSEAGRFRVETPKGAVISEKVLICTNAYSGDLHPRLAKSVLPVRSVQVATSPLSDNVRQSILPEGNALSDARRLLLYFRQDADGRFLMGGRGTYNDKSTLKQIERLKRISVELFPQLSRVQWEYEWGGFVALTKDHYPHLHEITPGVMTGLGYNGRGVAIATAMGRVLAKWATGTKADELEFPVTLLKPLPFSFAKETLVEAEILRLKLLDKLGL